MTPLTLTLISARPPRRYGDGGDGDLETGVDDRKALLKACKAACGGGGSLDLASGTLEVQGAHGDAILALVKKKGFSSAKKSGK